MYNPSLMVFKTVSDCGSFSKAAEMLFITHTSVIKQINRLEQHIGFKLFLRTTQGVKLTAAGQSFYKDTLKMIGFSDSAIKRAKAAEKNAKTIVRVGTSILYPCKSFFDIWYSMEHIDSDYALTIVPFEDSDMTMYRLGTDFDFIIGAFNSSLTSDLCSFIKLGEYPFCIAVPRTNKLSRAERLSFNDLHGETLHMMSAGNSVINDKLRQTILKNHPEIIIRDIEYHYDFQTFNSCAEKGGLLLSLSCWNEVHPALATVTLDEGFSLPYGIIAHNDLRSNVRDFIEEVSRQKL